MSDSEKNEKRGAPKGRRPTIYVCAAIVDGKLVQREMVVQDQNPDPESKVGSFPKEIAIANFKQEFGVEPEAISIPVFENKGINKKSTATKKRLTFDRSNIDDYRLDDELKRARYGHWSGLANMCVNDDEKAFFVPLTRIDGDDGKKYNPPGAGIVNAADLVFEDQNTEVEATA
jgi:hypothetical protein